MTDKITLASIGSLINDTAAVTAINSNNAILTSALDNTLSRDGTSPNQMTASLDMNSNQILNLPAPGTLHSPARLVDLTGPAPTLPAPAWTIEGNVTSASAPVTNFTIDGLTLKSTPNSADEVILWDVAGSAIKKATVGTLAGPPTSAPAWTITGNVTNASAPTTNFTIDGLTLKSTPATADEIILWDVAGASIKKSTLGTLPPPASGTITNAMLANMPAWTIKGNVTNAGASPTNFTVDGLTLKATPDAADELILWDVAGSALKKTTFSAFGGGGSLPASSVTWTQSGTGAVATNVDVRLKELYVTPQDFGGGPGAAAATNDSAISNALTYLASVGGGILFFPRGTYNISTSINVSSNNIGLIGEGGGLSTGATTSTIVQNTVTTFVIQATASNCVFGNLALTYVSPAVTGSALFANGCRNNVYYNLSISNIVNGIDSHAENVAFYTNILINGNATTNTGFYLNATLNLCISNAVIAGASAGTGILMDGPSEGNNFYGIEVFQWNIGLAITNDSGSNTGIAHVPWSNRFVSCYFDNTQTECFIKYGYDIEFTNCYFASIWNGITVGGTGTSAGAAATVGQTDTIVFTGCSFNGCGANGIALIGTGSANTGIVNCQAYNNGTTVTGDGIHVLAGTTDFRIIGCLSKNTSRTNFGGSGQHNGITVDSGSSDRYIIAFNNVGPNGSSTNGNVNVGVSDSGVGTNKTVTGNF